MSDATLNLFRFRPLVLFSGLFLTLLVIAVPGLLSLDIEPDASVSLLPKSGRDARFYQDYLQTFPADFGALIVLSGDICKKDVWDQILHLSSTLEDLELVDRIFTLPNAPHVAGEGDTVRVGDFVDHIEGKADNYCQLAAGYPAYNKLLINQDKTSSALYVIATNSTNAIEFTEAIHQVLAIYLSTFKDLGVSIYHSGELQISTEISKQTAISSNLIIIVILLMAIVAWLLTGSRLTGALSAATGAFGVYFTFSLMGYLGVTQTPINVLMANMLIPLGAAFTIHAFHYVKSTERLRYGFFPEAAIKPFLFATLSTMVGFGCTAMSHSPDIQEFGYFGMFGILACLLTTSCVTFPLLVKHAKNVRPKIEVTFPHVVLSKYMTVLVSLGLIIISSVGLSKLSVNYGPIDYLPEDNNVRQQIEKAGQDYARSSIPLVVSTGKKDGVVNVELWQKIKTFVDEQEEKIPNLKIAWLYDQVETLGEALNSGDAAAPSFPTNNELLSQMLLLFDPKDISQYIDFNRESLVLILQTPFRKSSELRLFEKELSEYFGGSNLKVELTGRIANFYRIGDQIALDNLSSLGLGICAVFLLFLSITGQFKTSIVVVFVNALPVLGTLSFIGIFGLDLDIGTSIVSAVALGLVVDDTGHMMMGYRKSKLKGETSKASTKTLFQNYQSTVTVTTITIVIGFSAMNFAGLIPFHSFSQLLSATVAYALVCDLIILPNLLTHFDA